jgi:hypothetical protein
MEVLTTSGRAAAVVFDIEPDCVEVWHHDRCRGAFDREILRSWLEHPVALLGAGEVVLTVDPSTDPDARVVISLRDVQLWPLSPGALMALRTRV